jgi:hypothetical protein
MGFNKSHAVAYSLISYWCCWLKARYPVEFAAATLSHEPRPEMQIKLLRELAAEGIGYIPVDPEVSEKKWAIKQVEGRGKVVVGPLSAVKGIGPKMVSTILSSRARKEPLPERAKKLLTHPKTEIDSLWPVRDAFERLLPEPRARNILTAPTPIGEVDQKKDDGKRFLFFCILSKINPRDENEVVLVARRGYEIKHGSTLSLNLQLTDDTGSIFGKIRRQDYLAMGKDVVDRGKPGRLLYAVKGEVQILNAFTKFNITAIRYIGDIKEPISLPEEPALENAE